MDASRAFFAPLVAGAAGDILWVAHLDGQARCIHLARYVGGTGTDLPTREIINDAAAHGSAGILLARRGPSPLTNDRRARPNNSIRQLAEAAEVANVTLLDELVFAGTECASMRRTGLI